MSGITAEGEKVGGNMARRAGEWLEPKVRGWEGLAGVWTDKEDLLKVLTEGLNSSEALVLSGKGMERNRL